MKPKEGAGGGAPYSKFESMEHFKRELIEYIDYYSTRRIKAK